MSTEKELLEQVAVEQSEDASGPVFIIGCPRSGTSALSWAVAQNPEFWTSAESDFMHHLLGMSRMRQAYDKAFDRPDQGWLLKNNVSYDEFCAYLGSGIDRLFRSRSGERRWVDATPGHTLMAPDIASLFPTARFLHIVRDGRAVVCSMLKSGFGFDWSNDFKAACFTWAHYVKKGLEFESGSASHRVLRVRHEQLVESPEQTMNDVQLFLGSSVSAKCGDFLRTKRINSSYDNTTSDDIRKSKDTARLHEKPWEEWSASKTAIFRSTAGSILDELGISQE